MTYGLMRGVALFPAIFLAVAAVGHQDGPKPGATDAAADRHGSGPLGAAAAEVVLFRKAIDCTREVVLVRSPLHSAQDVAPPLISKKAFEHLIPNGGFFSFSAQMRRAGKPPLTLATLILPEPVDAPASGGFAVFDVLVDDGLIFVAVASVGIEIWRVSPHGDPRASRSGDLRPRKALPQICAVGLPADWAFSRVATFAYPTPASFSVKLSLTRQGRVQADVVDLKAADRRHTRFVEFGDDWMFGVVPLGDLQKRKGRKDVKGE